MSKFKRKNKIDRESADEQVKLLNEFYDVDLEFLTENVAALLEQYLLYITKSVCRGRLSIDETETGVVITQHLEKPSGRVTKLTYGEVDARVSAAADKAEGHDKVLAVAAAMTKTDASVIKKFSRVDLSDCENLGNYFLFV